MLQKCSIFVTSENATVCMPGHPWKVFIFFFHDLHHGQALSPSFFPHMFPIFPYLMSKKLFNSTAVSSGGYVNIYWHDSQQQWEGGNCYILPFREPSNSLSECAVSENRKGLQFVLDLMCFCSLGSCFVADVICIAVEGFISSWGNFPLHTQSHHSRLELQWRKMVPVDLLAFASTEMNSTTVTLALLLVFLVLLYW